MHRGRELCLPRWRHFERSRVRSGGPCVPPARPTRPRPRSHSTHTSAAARSSTSASPLSCLRDHVTSVCTALSCRCPSLCPPASPLLLLPVGSDAGRAAVSLAGDGRRFAGVPGRTAPRRCRLLPPARANLLCARAHSLAFASRLLHASTRRCLLEQSERDALAILAARPIGPRVGGTAGGRGVTAKARLAKRSSRDHEGTRRSQHQPTGTQQHGSLPLPLLHPPHHPSPATSRRTGDSGRWPVGAWTRTRVRCAVSGVRPPPLPAPSHSTPAPT